MFKVEFTKSQDTPLWLAVALSAMVGLLVVAMALIAIYA